jgi:two-component system sensor histidine kinase GlrK
VAGTLNAQQREIAGILRQSTFQLQKRIEDLLSFSVAHLRNAALHVTPVELQGTLENVLHDHKLAMMNKGLKLALDAASITLPCDEEKIAVVIDNLLSNAIKYSPPGGAIRVRLAHEGECAVLDVIDEGPGIGLDEQDKVFKGFYQGKAARDGQVAGTGLGLSIAREYVAAHKGDIRVVNDQAGGTHLRVTLPVNLSWGTQ